MDAAAIGPPERAGLGPIGSEERIETIDVLRGLAILGILFANIHDFSFPAGFDRFHAEIFDGAVDRAVRRGLQLLIEAKFYSMFSVLFGLGAAVQMSRAEQRGERFGSLYTRRLLVLFMIGLIHDIFLWTGGILIAYSTLGFLLLPFRKRRPKTLVWWAAGLTLVPLLVLSIVIPLTTGTPGAEDGDASAVEETRPQEDVERRIELEEALAIFQSGRYIDQVKYRAREMYKMLLAILGLSPYIVAMFLLGAWAWRKGIFQNIDAQLPRMRKILLWVLVPGLVGNLALAWIRATYTAQPPAAVMAVGIASFLIGVPALCAFYIVTVVLLLRRPRFGRLLSALAPVGRTALSNYLFQTLVCTTIFYSYGFAWFGRIGPTLNLALTMAILAVQVVLSGWWVRHFRFGPTEWLWRSLTYRRLQRMRIGPGRAA